MSGINILENRRAIKSIPEGDLPVSFKTLATTLPTLGKLIGWNGGRDIIVSHDASPNVNITVNIIGVTPDKVPPGQRYDIEVSEKPNDTFDFDPQGTDFSIFHRL